MAYGAFGDIRALLHGAPSLGTWEKLCAEVRLWREPELSQVVFPYVLAQLERWPDELRVIRPAWTKDLLRGRAKGAHYTAMARQFVVEDAAPEDAQWDNLTALDWRSLRHIRLARVEGSGALLERLRDASVMSHVDALYLGGGDLGGVIGAHAALGTFENLRELHLVGSSPTEDDLLEFAVADWPHLQSLTLNHWDDTTRRGAYARHVHSLEPLTSGLYAPGLRRVDISMLDCSLEATEELLRAAWLHQLTHLTLHNEYAIQAASYDHHQRFNVAIQRADLRGLERLTFNQIISAATVTSLAGNPNLSNMKSLGFCGKVRHGYYSYDMIQAIRNSPLPEAVRAEWRDGPPFY